jgi:hypothetical protein
MYIKRNFYKSVEICKRIAMEDGETGRENTNLHILVLQVSFQQLDQFHLHHRYA